MFAGELAGEAVRQAETGSERWYAVRVRSRFEPTTSAALRARGLTEFVPTYRSRRVWSDRVKELDLPLFPGYVFCRFDASYAYPVLNSPGVVHIVSAGNRPIPVDDREMEAVRAICAADLPALPWSQLAVGQRMVVVRGPLKGTEGMIVRIKDSYRLVASISLLNRGVSIELDHTWIAPVC